MSDIQITNIGEPSPHVDCAGRIARLLEIALQDSTWVYQCHGTIRLTHFLNTPEDIIIKGIFSGQVNGREFSHPFECVLDIDPKLSPGQFLASPILIPLLAIFRAFHYEQDPDKRATAELTRAELDVAASLQLTLNKIVGAPVEGIQAVWRQALIGGGVLFLLVTIAVNTYCYFHPKPNAMKDPNEALVLKWIATAISCGGPAAVGAIFLRLIFVGRDIEETVAGQSLLRFIGAKSVTGLRVISVIATILGFGVAANFARLLAF